MMEILFQLSQTSIRIFCYSSSTTISLMLKLNDRVRIERTFDVPMGSNVHCSTGHRNP